MTTIICFICFFAGLAVDSFYRKSSREIEAQAYVDGYKRAKEEEMLCEQARAQVPTTEPKKGVNIHPDFVEIVRQNGHATMRIQ